MGLAGGIIGGIIGGLVGGPWGFAIGAGLGACLNNDSENKRKWDEFKESAALEAWFLSLGKLAKADGVVTQNEADFVSELLRMLEVSGPQKKQLINAFNRGKNDPHTFAQCVQTMKPYFTERPERLRLMQTYCILAIADGAPDAASRSMLESAEKVLCLSGYTASFMAENLRSGSQKQQSRPPGSGLAEAYQILEISPSAADDEVKQARRKKIMEYHPDRIQGKGLPDSFIQFAAEQTRRINEAYELICAERGMKS